MDFSVLMSIYKNSKTDEIILCLESVLNQTFKSNDVVIVIDGSIPKEIDFLLKVYQKKYLEIKIYPIEKNVGLGEALKYGLNFCKNNLVARMDTDDICAINRFEKQILCFTSDNSLSLVGSNIAEFTDEVNNVTSYRNVPEFNNDICTYLKKRCPLNHVSVMFKKNEVLEAGNYKPFFYNEDYYLWIRMFLKKCKFYNVQENLVYCKIDKNTFKRRGGIEYFKSELKIQNFMLKNKVINVFRYLINVILRFILQILFTNKMRYLVYQKIARKK